MGVFHIDCEVAPIGAAGKPALIRKVLVDTGSEYTWLPQDVLKKAGIKVRKKDLVFVMANGMEITRHVGYALLRASGFETVDEVVFGQDGDLSLLGARTLEGFPAIVDPHRKRLVAAGPLPAARTEK